jgi:hypothetical protein
MVNDSPKTNKQLSSHWEQHNKFTTYSIGNSDLCQRKWWRYMNICRVERKHWTLVRTCTLQFRGKSNKKLSQENMCVSVLIQDLNFQCYMSWICCVVLNEKRVVNFLLDFPRNWSVHVLTKVQCLRSTLQIFI